MDFKICYKYPFVSSEILGCEIVGLIKAFFEDAQDGDSHLSFSKNFDQDESNGNIKDQEKEFEGNEDEKKLSTPKKKVLETLKEEIGKL